MFSTNWERMPRLPSAASIEQDIGSLRIAHGDHADFVGLDLKDSFDGAFERMLQSDDAIRLQSERLNRLDIERIGEIGGPKLDQAEFLLEIGIMPQA